MHCKLRQTSVLRSLIAASIAVLGLAVANAAPLSPAWTRHFTAPIQWQRVTAFGQLLVSTSGGLHAVDPNTGAVAWSLPGLADLPESGVVELAGSPLVLISDTAASPRTVVLNAFSGKLVFDSRAANLGQISAPRVLPGAGSLLVAGFETGKPAPWLFLYSMEDGRQLWKSDVLGATLNPGGNALLNALMSAALVVANVDPVQSAPLELGDGTFILGAMGHVMRFDQASGQVLWKTRFAGGVFEFRQASERPDVVYVGAEETQRVVGADQTTRESKQTLYQGFRLSDGSPTWNKPVRFNKPMNRSIIPLDRGLIVSDGDRDKGKVHLLAYDTGESLWGNKGKGIEISGQVLDYSFAGTDLVLTSGYDSIWTNKDTEYLLYVLDTAAGRFRFERPFTVKGRMLGTELTDRGLVYVTTHEINVFDPATGGMRNAPVLRSKAPLVTTNAGRLVYAFNADDGYLYRFDRDTGTIARFSQQPFELADEDRARALDLVDDTV
ncbi:MAG TPA: PQQ-binding-like beta-propeller repeat protein, partial [Vicinamibacterales bacterium]|nr:PQQ-binding-like beta-propeller repeat protein [Vicinamibacterales bacterium]